MRFVRILVVAFRNGHQPLAHSYKVLFPLVTLTNETSEGGGFGPRLICGYEHV
jgi:hypothetical protein